MWGFDTESTVPLPVGAVQLVLAWLAARDVRPPVGLVAAVLLSAFCLISLMFGLFDGDLINNVAPAGWISWGVVWGVVLTVGHRCCLSSRRSPGEAAVPASLTRADVRAIA